MKKKLYIITALLLPMVATAQLVQVPNPCFAGRAFTIKIPVKFPDSMTVQYAWYRNDTLIEDSHTLLLGEKAIAYTIPADKAFGSAVYHFTYNLHDEHDGEWTRSPRYMVNFLTITCPAINAPGTIGIAACSGVSGAGTVGVAACNGVSGAGTVGVTTCNGVSGAGTVGVATCNGVSGAGTVGVTTCNGVSGAGTVGIATCSGVSGAGTVGITACSGLSSAGTITISR